MHYDWGQVHGRMRQNKNESETASSSVRRRLWEACCLLPGIDLSSAGAPGRAARWVTGLSRETHSSSHVDGFGGVKVRGVLM